MSADLFSPADIPFNLAGELLDNSTTSEGEARVRALTESEARKAQMTLLCDAPDKRNHYRTAWTLVGGYSFTSRECVAVRYIGLGQFRINETPETLHECHLTDFCL